MKRFLMRGRAVVVVMLIVASVGVSQARADIVDGIIAGAIGGALIDRIYDFFFPTNKKKEETGKSRNIDEGNNAGGDSDNRVEQRK
ncbi:MAG: hypothetical protein LBG48_05975 [Rickettsiales bacterium]|jgi:hypothetical protein|nr:hypothetical protein [Rickettsiales bacterium]